MKRRLLAAVLFAVSAVSARAATPLLVDYDIDSTTFVYPILCTPGLVVAPNRCPGDGWSNGKLITTAGASSTTVTDVTATDDAFANAAAGDLIAFTPTQSSAVTIRRITAKASADSITIDVATTIPAAGVTFRLWNQVVGTGAADDGWFRYPGNGNLTIVLAASQINATSVDYHVQCRHTYQDRYTTPVYVAGTAATPVVLASGTTAAAGRVTLTDEGFDSCRVGIKVTSDDGGDLTTNTEKITVTISSPAGH